MLEQSLHLTLVWCVGRSRHRAKKTKTSNFLKKSEVWRGSFVILPGQTVQRSQHTLTQDLLRQLQGERFTVIDWIRCGNCSTQEIARILRGNSHWALAPEAISVNCVLHRSLGRIERYCLCQVDGLLQSCCLAVRPAVLRLQA